MNTKIEKFYIILMIFLLTICAPPPPEKKLDRTVIETPSMIVKENSLGSSFKRLESARMTYLNLTQILTFYEDYKIEELEFIISTENLPDRAYYPSWGFTFSSGGAFYEVIENTCEILYINDLSPSASKCLPSSEVTNNNRSVRVFYNISLHNTEMLKVNIKFKETDLNKEILYKTEIASIPFYPGFSFCNSTFILSEGFKSLGLSNNALNKEADNIYSYYDQCPNKTTSIDIIRFAPQRTYWKADMKMFIKNEDESKIEKNVGFIFPIYYRGGKLINTYYEIFNSLND